MLTNDGALKRRLELPSTGWLRKYRVRVNGNPMDPDLEPLRKGIEIEGERFQPMIAVIDRIQGANAWLTVGLREGKNREIRRAMNAIGLTVNRLIRVSYGPFRLNDLQPGQVEEVKGKVLRDQLGEGRTPEDEAPRRDDSPRKVVRAPRPGVASRTPTGSKAETARPKSGAKPARSDNPRGEAGRFDGGRNDNSRAEGGRFDGGRAENPRADSARAKTGTKLAPRAAKTGSALAELSKSWVAATTPKTRAPASKKPPADKASGSGKTRATPAGPRPATSGRPKPGPRPKRGE